MKIVNQKGLEDIFKYQYSKMKVQEFIKNFKKEIAKHKYIEQGRIFIRNIYFMN